MAKKTQSQPWKNKICNPAQVGGIETSVLDDGPGRGTRIAWINTGTPLRYKVVIDRAMDIVDAFYGAASLAWISHGGITAPRPDANAGLEWLYTFSGGLVTTCGLTHVGGPESDENGQRGLHGRISNLPACIESIQQPDPAAGILGMSITGVIKQSRVFGPSLELRRTISGKLGEPTIRIHDVVSNRGTQTIPHMLLYHCNFGWPLVDQGVDILYNGVCRSRGLDMDNAVFNDRRNYRKGSGPLESHRDGGEGCGFIDAVADKKGIVTAGLYNRKLKFALQLRYTGKKLPCLANWQHWGIGDYVCALEPGTNFPIGQAAARKQKKLLHLAPGKSRTYDLEFTILTQKEEIQKLLRLTGASR
ncbi:MAG: aldose 1-epimerase family protein [Sedimentisphaerales bacterium]|nr:aldose 1-epimerase family protein [Sedimentisphaerales bacterium]